jgi:methionyl-tRNA synthetase
MSKTLGTGVDPTALVDAWGVDAVRSWLLREVPPCDDADYTEEAFARAYTSRLANGLGNLLQRTISMVRRYRGGVVAPCTTGGASPLADAAAEVPAALHATLGAEWDPRRALDAVFAVVDRANATIDEAKPWALAKAGDSHALDAVLSDVVEALRIVSEALRPLLPTTTAERIAAQLGVTPSAAWTDALHWSGLPGGTRAGDPVPLFPQPQT